MPVGDAPDSADPAAPAPLDLQGPAAAWLREAMASSRDLVLTVDLQRRVTFWNRGCEELYGWQAQEILGHPLERLVPEDQREELYMCLESVRRGEDVPPLETVRRTRDGRRVDISCRLAPLHDDDGNLVGALAIGRDITLEKGFRRQLEEVHSHLRARLDQSHVAHATLALDGRYTYVNDAYCRLLGFPREALEGQLAPNLDVERRRSVNERLLRELGVGERDALVVPRTLVRPDDSVVHVDAYVSAIRDTDGEVTSLAVTLQDVTEARTLQSRLRAEAARERSLSVRASDVGFLAEPDGTVQYVSEALWGQFGWRTDEVVGRSIWDFCHPEDAPQISAGWELVARGELDRLVADARVRRADGSWTWAEGTVVSLLDDPDVASVVVNLRDVSQRKAAEQSLGEVALRDQLTGVANRAVLLDRSTQALERLHTSGHRVGMLMLDLDDFSVINDELGHTAGDEVLMTVAQLLEAVAGPFDTVARVGNDQFAVLIEDLPTVEELGERAAQVQALLAAGVGGRSRTISLSASIGLAHRSAGSGEALLAAAETALHLAKHSGTCSIRAHDESDTDSRRERRLATADLQRGLTADEMVVHYQPVMDLRSGAPVGVEALVRWQHPERGLLMPGAFLDVAESSGLILPLGQDVLRKACRAAARWASGHGGHLSVAVNLSLRQLAEPGVVDMVEEALSDSGLPASRLLLEVTETAVASDIAATTATLAALRDKGIDIAIDDFGTGYSSLTYLRQFPVTAVKIDRSFVQGLVSDSDDSAIVASVVSLAQATALTSVAEGVEDLAQAEALLAMGCALGQGYLWSRPLPEDELLQWLAAAAWPRVPATAATIAPTRWSRPDEHVEPYRDVLQRVEELQRAGASLHTIAAALNTEGRRTPQGHRWHARSVARLLAQTDPGAATT